MSQLATIPGIGKASLELLEAAGFLDADAIARAGADELAAELKRANLMLQITKQTPGRGTVEKWILAAREMTGASLGETASPARMPVDYEQTEQGAAMLATAPFAIPLPVRTLMANQLGVADVPPAILFNRYSGELDVRISRKLPDNRSPKPAAVSNHYVKISETSSQRMDIDTSRLRSTQDMGEPLARQPAARTSQARDRGALLRAPRSETNKGRNPQSRWYIRGVLHSHPLSIMLGALVTLLLVVFVPVGIASALLLLLSGEMPARFSWVPGWLIVFPLILPALGLCYLFWGMGCTCRICGQGLFRHKSHRKNSRAHHVPGLGYVVPLCLHILVFRWFRCTHCGTPVRLKE
jgi:energy-converting hydrogenase Eha subunit A